MPIKFGTGGSGGGGGGSVSPSFILETVEKTNNAAGYDLAGGSTTSKTLTVTETSTIDQDLQKSAAVEHASLKLSGLGEGTLVSDANGDITSTSAGGTLFEWDATIDGDPSSLTGISQATFVGSTSWITATGSQSVQITPNSTSQTGWIWWDLGQNYTNLIVEIGYSASGGGGTDGTIGDGFTIVSCATATPTASDDPTLGFPSGVSVYADSFNGGSAAPDPLKLFHGTSNLATDDTNGDLFGTSNGIIYNLSLKKDRNVLTGSVEGKGSAIGSVGFMLDTSTQTASGRYIAVGCKTGAAFADQRLHYIRVRQPVSVNSPQYIVLQDNTQPVMKPMQTSSTWAGIKTINNSTSAKVWEAKVTAQHRIYCEAWCTGVVTKGIIAIGEYTGSNADGATVEGSGVFGTQVGSIDVTSTTANDPQPAILFNAVAGTKYVMGGAVHPDSATGSGAGGDRINLDKGFVAEIQP
jgi:hypothetical protein